MKTRSFQSNLRGVIFLTICTTASHAAVINPDATTGNLIATSANNGANTIAAKGGTNPAPYTVTVDLGTILTGDSVQQVGINITKAGYTIHNNGSLSGDQFGVKSTVSAIIENTGTISGVTAGITTTADLVLNNTGTISGTDGIRFNGASTNDTLNHTGGSIISTTGAAGNAALLGSGDDTFLISGTATVTGIVNMGTGNDTATINGGNINGNLTLGDGDDSVTIGSAASITSVIGGNGLDSYTIDAALTGNIDAQGDADTITLNAGSSVTGTVNSGTGDDTVTITGGSITGTLNLNDGNDLLTLNGASSATSILGGNGADTITVNGTHTGNIDAQGDADTITINAGTSVTGTVNAGIGDDTVTITGGTIIGTLNLNEGGDILTVSGTSSATSIVAGNGTDTINLSGSFTGDIDAQGDNDAITLASGASLTGNLLGGTGNDTATLTDNTIIGTLNLGDGTDTLTLAGNNSITSALGGLGQDTVSIAGTFTGSIDTGTDNDTLTLANGTVINGSIVLGAGNDSATVTSVTINNGSLNLGEGDDAAVLNGDNVLKLTAGGGNDVLTINGTQYGDVDAGTGDDLITLADGTVMTGNVTGAGDIDTLTMTSSATVNGNISAMEVVNKQGVGTATVTGNITSEQINLTGGSLFINGNVNQSNLPGVITTSGDAVHLGGATTSFGSWNADLIHAAGTFSPGSTLPAQDPLLAVSTLALNSANFNGGSLLVHMDPVLRTSDLVKLTGNLAINNSRVVISPLSQDAPLADVETTLIEVAGTTTGKFLKPVIIFEKGHTDTGIRAAQGNGVFTPVTFSLTTVPSTLLPNNLALKVVHHYQALPGLSGFGAALATGMNSLTDVPVADPELADFLASIDYGNAAASAALLNSYEPTEYLALQKYTVASSTLLHRIVENENDITRYSKAKNHSWGNINANGGDSTSYRITAGVSGSSMFDDATFGALVSQMNMDDLTGINGDLSTITFGAYLGSGNLVGWQWNAFAGYLMAEGDVNGGVNSYSPEGDGFQLLASGAYTFEYDRVTWGPTFGFEHVSMTPDDTTLTANTAGQPDIKIGSDTLDSTRLLLGVKSEFDLPGRTTPYLSLQYAKELQGEWDGYHGSISGSSFDVDAPVDLEDSFILRAGVSHIFNDTWQAHAGYLGQISTSSDGTDVHGLNMGVQANF